jgi:hypothetical protein
MARKRPWDYTEEEEDNAPPPAKPCWFCQRPLGENVDAYHPVPKSKGGRAVVSVHPICNQTIHANFTNAQLARIGEDVEALRNHEAMAKFLTWVEGKDPDFFVPTTKKGR